MGWPFRIRTGRTKALMRAAVLGLAVLGGLAALAAAPARAAVDDPDSVDALRALPDKPLVVMVIIQDRPWGPETRVMVGNKLGGYMRYALGGQLVRDWPHAAGKPVRIALVSETAPEEADTEALAAFRDQIAAIGLEFVWGGEDDLLDMVGER